MKHKLSILIFLLLSQCAFGQLGGQHSFEFLSLPSSARVTALGGSVIAVNDDDLSLALHNPAVLDSSSHNFISFNHHFHLADISNGFFNYARNLPWLGLTAHAGAQYVNYGEFALTDEIGNTSGTFDAKDLALVFGVARQMNERIRLGLNLKLINSSYESYSSTGLASDLGLYYENPESNFSAGIVVQHVGIQLSSFVEEKESLPLDVQLGISKKLEHLPFRFSVIAHNLQTFGIRYDDPNIAPVTDIFGEVQSSSRFEEGLDNFFRHFIFSGEFLLGKKENLRLRFGYNHLRRKELKVSEFQSIGGFSLGFGLKVYKFRIDYGVGYYHLGGNTNHLSITTNLQEFRKKI